MLIFAGYYTSVGWIPFYCFCNILLVSSLISTYEPFFKENSIVHNVSPNLSRLNGQILVKHWLDPGQPWPNLGKVIENVNFNTK